MLRVTLFGLLLFLALTALTPYLNPAAGIGALASGDTGSRVVRAPGAAPVLIESKATVPWVMLSRRERSQHALRPAR